ncbi:glycerophosphodiester phosphodiesterase family protein [Anaerosacchariphilus polymeriproducens]|uniref:GP-PDE domain-containing protein n=1 Tax=Anaerosacchariphilus polymeriproducens TaxID=1812858 RepID=A0A371B022_9FIRM|nr:glycerophosphodiester phosphodiesterase family protein [Anaerosacchariphilus polymeriproducens]RDU25218.1 hypothetical protein DWV06_00405 [Anaerosacchariphilus polymeriproducens]
MKKNKKYLYLIVAFVVFIIASLYWNSQPYYQKYHHIAHALGGIDKVEYTNSLEALNLSYNRGIRLMEVDFLYTNDGHLVCRHNWNEEFGDGFSKKNIPDHKTFMESKINGVYTTLDIESIIRFAMEHPDVYFVTDIKSYKFDICEAVELIIDTAEELGFSEIDEQFIIQVYNYEDYEKISERFSFQNFIFSLYRMKDELKNNGINDILDFCMKNEIKVVTLPKKYATREICNQLKVNGIKVFVYTIDSRKTWLKLKLTGVDGIYTNYIYPMKISRWFFQLMSFFDFSKLAIFSS